MSFAIECQDLHVRYRSKSGKPVEAVSGLSFEVQKGEIVGFLGPNGAGKSSTLKALMGFLEPKAGSAHVLGSAAGSIESRRRTGYLPEVAMYYPFLSPLETLTLYGELQGLSGKGLRNESYELLERVGLTGSVKKQNRTLSKGMLQRVGIAQSLLGNPELLILDEVTSGLDPIGRRELRSLLQEKNKQGTTLFFSSHELSEVSRICDRILILDKGKLIAERNLLEVEESLSKYSLTYSSEVSFFDISQEIEKDEFGNMRATFATKGALIEAIDRVRVSGGKVIDIVADQGSLEDYFLETLGVAA
jgi:ABC-2 type transport system ATP-binding protein